MNRTVAPGGRPPGHSGPPGPGGPRQHERTMMIDPRAVMAAAPPASFEKNSKMASMFFASSELLAFASYLPEVGQNLPSADVLRHHLTVLFDRMNQRAREGGSSPDDIRDAQYALAAFIDEQVLKAPWNGRYEWQQRPLQLQWFGENTAGDNFFERMQMLSRSPARAHVLEVYMLCVAHGFQGRYAMTEPHRLGPILEQNCLTLSTALPPSEPLSPKGARKSERSALGRDAPIVRTAIAFFAVALFLFILLRVVLGFTTSSAEKTMLNYSGPPATTAAPLGSAK